ncbi:hypothetical protein Bbelb_294740 [Branchiostoma belcheri]|nr:hypothetical protein Bbelb_294740 [Branchiostoma belcheri]
MERPVLQQHLDAVRINLPQEQMGLSTGVRLRDTGGSKPCLNIRRALSFRLREENLQQIPAESTSKPAKYFHKVTFITRLTSQTRAIAGSDLCDCCEAITMPTHQEFTLGEMDTASSTEKCRPDYSMSRERRPFVKGIA